MFLTKVKVAAAALVLLATGLAIVERKVAAQRQTDTHPGAGGPSAPVSGSQTRNLAPKPVRITRPFACTIETVLVKVGQTVKKGHGLLTVQSDDLAAVKIRYLAAHDQWLRDQKALAAGSGARNIPVYPEAEKDYIELKNDVAQSRLKMRLARDRLLVYGLTEREIERELSGGEDGEFGVTVQSPVDGIVAQIGAKRGEAYNESTVLMVIDRAERRDSRDRPPVRLADIGPAPKTVLVDSQEKPFDLAKLRGKVVLVSFVYTTCNGVCPLTTQALGGVQKKLQEAELWGKSVEFVSITLDPKRDTPRVLRDYARLFKADPSVWHFMTGSSEQVGAVITAWDMWVKSDSNGVLDHPSRIFLIDPRGRQREIYNLEFLKAETVVQDVRDLINEK